MTNTIECVLTCCCLSCVLAHPCAQLLGDVVKKERPEVDKKRNDLIVSMAADKKQLKGIEDKILKLLSESEGNILDDEELIDTLSESKITSGVIKERLAESAVTEKQIEETRNQYRAAANRGSIIYFVVADLALVDPMYQYSLGTSVPCAFCAFLPCTPHKWITS